MYTNNFKDITSVHAFDSISQKSENEDSLQNIIDSQKENEENKDVK